MCENAYLSIKNPKASRALKRALNPGRRMLALLARLCFATSATFSLRSWGPPLDQILDPHLRRKENYLKKFDVYLPPCVLLVLHFILCQQKDVSTSDSHQIWSVSEVWAIVDMFLEHFFIVRHNCATKIS